MVRRPGSLFDSEGSRAKRAFLDATRSVFESQEFAVAARTIYDSSKNLIGATAGYVALLSDDGAENEVLFLDAGGRVCTVDPNLPMPIRGLRETAYRTGKAVCENGFEDSDWMRFMPAGHARLDNVLFAPLVVDDQVVGIMGLANKPGGFTTDDLELAGAFGELAAIALKNARAVERLKEREALLEPLLAGTQAALVESEKRLAEVNRLMASVLDHTHVLTVLLDSKFNFLWVNRAYADSGRREQTYFLGRNHFELYPHKENEAIFTQVVETGEPYFASAKPFGFPDQPDRGVTYWDWSLVPIAGESGDVDALAFTLLDVTQRVAAASALRSEQERAQRYLDTADSVIVALDSEGRITSMNRKGCAVLGRSESQLVGQDWFSECVASPPDSKDSAGASKRHITALCAGDSELWEIPIVTRAGEIRQFAWSQALLPEEAGGAAGVLLVGDDITERVRTEQAAAIHGRLHEFALEHTLQELLTETLDEVCVLLESPIGFYHFVDDDQEGLSLQAWSTATSETFCTAVPASTHYPISQAGVWVDCVPERRAVVHNDYVSLTHKKGLPEGHAPVVRELVVPVLRGGRVVAILGIGNKDRDYTDRDVALAERIADVAWEVAENRRTSDALAESEERYRTIVEHSPLAIFVSRDDAVTFVNQTCLDLFGASDPEDLVRSQVYELFDTGFRDQVRELTRALDTNVATRTIEGRIIRVDGSTVDVELSAVSIKRRCCDCIHYRMLDISERKRSAAEIERKTQRLADLASQLLRSGEYERRHVAMELHDGVGQALAAAKIGAQQLAGELAECEATEVAQRLVELIDFSLNGVRGLTAELSPPLLEAYGLGAALSWLADRFAEHGDLEVEISLDDAVEQLRSDAATLLFRTARELLANVHKHAGVKSAVLDVVVAGGEVVMRVKDAGCGFDAGSLDDAASLRERFGLFSIIEEVALSGGTVAIDSGPGRGSAVEVRVPADLSWSNRH